MARQFEAELKWLCMMLEGGVGKKMKDPFRVVYTKKGSFIMNIFSAACAANTLGAVAMGVSAIFGTPFWVTAAGAIGIWLTGDYLYDLGHRWMSRRNSGD